MGPSMTDILPATWPATARDPELRRAPAAFRTALRVAVENWAAGDLTFVLPSGKPLRIVGKTPGPDAVIRIHDYRFIRRALASGDIGFAEGYMAGEWDTPDLSAVLEAFSLNFDRLTALVRGNPVMQAVNKLYHLFHRNDRGWLAEEHPRPLRPGQRFYSRWLDPSMTYSSALYETPSQPLDQAQRAKYAALARSIDLKPGQHVLEIGCGWGGFAEFAAKEVGAKVTGVTISQAQHDFAKQAPVRAGPGREGRHPADRLSRRPGPVRQRRLDRDVRGRRRGILADLFRQDPRGAVARRPGRPADHHHPRRAVRPLSQPHRLHPALRLPGRHAAQRGAPEAGNEPPPAWPGPASTASARTTPTPWPNGPRGSRRPGTTSRARASTSGSAGCGGSISAIAKPASAPSAPM
jgi:hypothetical protein